MKDKTVEFLRGWRWHESYSEPARTVGTEIKRTDIDSIYIHFVKRATDAYGFAVMVVNEIDEPIDGTLDKFEGSSFAQCAGEMARYMKRLVKNPEIKTTTRGTLYALINALSELQEDESAIFFEMAYGENVSAQVVKTAVRLVRNS